MAVKGGDYDDNEEEEEAAVYTVPPPPRNEEEEEQQMDFVSTTSENKEEEEETMASPPLAFAMPPQPFPRDDESDAVAEDATKELAKTKQQQDELKYLALSHCMELASILNETRVPPSKQWIAQFCNDLAKLYELHMHCPLKGLAAIAAMPHAASVAQTFCLMFKSQPPVSFALALLLAFKEAQRFDVLYMISTLLNKVLKAQHVAGRNELSNILLFGLRTDPPRGNREEDDLYEKYSWAKHGANANHAFPWFESTFDFHDMRGTMQRVQLICENRAVARPITLEIDGEVFVGNMVVSGERDFALQSTLSPNVQLMLHWNVELGEIWGTLEQDGSSVMRGFFAKQYRPISQHVFTGERMPAKPAQCVVLRQGMCFQLSVIWSQISSLSMWVYIPSATAAFMVILNSAFLQVAVNDQGQFQICGQDTQVVACTGKWTFMSISLEGDKVTVFQDDTVVFSSSSISSSSNSTGEEEFLTLGAKDGSGRNGLDGGSFCELTLIGPASSTTMEFPLVCYEKGSMQVLASANNDGLPLVCCNKYDDEEGYLPAPHGKALEHEPGRILEPFANLAARGFTATLQFSKQTSACSLVIYHGTNKPPRMFVCSLVRTTESTLSCRVEHNGEEICTVWNVSNDLLQDTLTCEFKQGYFTLESVVRIPLQLNAVGLCFVRAEVAQRDGLLKFEFAALDDDDDVPFALPLPNATVAAAPLLGPKPCSICTFSNEPNAVACAMCGSHEFDQRQQQARLVAPSNEWKDKWNKFRDGFLKVPNSAPLQHVLQCGGGGSNELVLQLGAEIVLFQCSALINAISFPAQVMLGEEGTHWQVHVRNAFDYRIDATGKRVLSHSLGWSDSTAVTLQQQVRTSQVTLKNMAPGLVNVCFQNSILQCLFACKEIRHLLLLLRDPSAASTFPVFRELNLLFQSMCASPEAMLLTTSLQQVLPSRFREGRQMDAQEFVTFLVDEFERGVQDKAELNAVLAVKTWQERTCKKCNETRRDSTPLLSHTGLVLNLPRQFYPITNLRLVTCQSVGEWLPACEENEVRLMENLNSHGGFCYLYVKREPDAKPITAIAAKPLPNGDELNMGSVKLYFTRDEHAGLPITDLTLFEGSSVQAGVPCGRRYKLVHHSTMPITDIYVGTAAELAKLGGVNRLPRALGENSRGEAMFLGYSCAFNKPPLTQLDASIAAGEEDDPTAVVCAEINGQQWRFVQSWGVGSPIIRLEVVSNKDTQGELVDLAHGDKPIWKVETVSSRLPSRLFSQTLLGDCTIHTQLVGSIGEFRFEDGVVVQEEDEISVMCRLRADGSLHARWDKYQLKWITIGEDVFEKKHIYQLEQRKASDILQGSSNNKFVPLCLLQNGEYLVGRLYKLHNDEMPLNDIQVQTLVGNEYVDVDFGYKEAFSFPPDESGLVVRVCTTCTAVGMLPLRDISFASPQTIRRTALIDKGQVTPEFHLFVEHEREDEMAWEGVFYNSEGKRLTLFSGMTDSVEHGKRIEFTFGGNTNVFQGVCLPDKRAWGFMHHQTAALPLFVRVEWEHAAKLVLRSYYYNNLPCSLLLDNTRIRIHRDCREYWQENACLFSTRVRNNNVSTLCAMELADTCVLAGENMVECESGKNNCHGSKQPHISRKRVELPSTLVVHLNRMQFEPNRGTVKDHTIISLGNSEVLHLQGDDYALLAVVSHTGSSAESGHYRAYCRYSVDDETWLLLDDSKPVTKVIFASMAKTFECQQKSEETPYLLFYGRKGKGEEEEDAVVAVPRKQELIESFLQKYSASQPILEARRFDLGL